MTTFFWSPTGEPMTAEEFEVVAQDDQQRVVAVTEVGDAKVSTVWLGVDYGLRQGGPPIIFETMVFGGAHDAQIQRYATKAEAAERHEQVVQAMRRELEIES